MINMQGAVVDKVDTRKEQMGRVSRDKIITERGEEKD